MANISYNQIHETLDEAKMALILQKIQEIADLLPKGTLTDAERKSYHALDVRNLIFCGKGGTAQEQLWRQRLAASVAQR